MRSDAGLLAAVVLTVVVAHAAPRAAWAQVATPDGPSAGVTLGSAGVGNSWSGGGRGPMILANVEVPGRGTGRIRVEAGVVGWRPSNEPLEGGVQAGHVRIRFVTVTVTRNFLDQHDILPIALYWGLGAGGFRYGIREGAYEHQTRWGIHGVAGIQHTRPNGRLGIRFEAAMHMTGGPGHRQVWAHTVPSLTAGIGVTRRF